MGLTLVFIGPIILGVSLGLLVALRGRASTSRLLVTAVGGGVAGGIIMAGLLSLSDLAFWDGLSRIVALGTLVGLLGAVVALGLRAVLRYARAAKSSSPAI